MKTGIDRSKVKKTLTVATAITGVTAGATAFLPTAAAHAGTGGWVIKVTLGARIQFASAFGTDLKGSMVTEKASNYTASERFSIPFTENGVQRTFAGPQLMYFEYGGAGVSTHFVGCPIPAGSGTMVWKATVHGFSC
jgi:hypothetical protein